MKITSTITVREGFNNISMLNELEWINGDIWANVWQTDDIIVINPNNGIVKQRFNFSKLKDHIHQTYSNNIDVLNGIAWDKTLNRIFLTGKLWPYIYEVQIND